MNLTLARDFRSENEARLAYHLPRIIRNQIEDPMAKKTIAKTRRPARPLYRLEHRAHAVISRHRFALRMALAGAIWLGLTVVRPRHRHDRLRVVRDA